MIGFVILAALATGSVVRGQFNYPPNSWYAQFSLSPKNNVTCVATTLGSEVTDSGPADELCQNFPVAANNLLSKTTFPLVKQPSDFYAVYFNNSATQPINGTPTSATQIQLSGKDDGTSLFPPFLLTYALTTPSDSINLLAQIFVTNAGYLVKSDSACIPSGPCFDPISKSTIQNGAYSAANPLLAPCNISETVQAYQAKRECTNDASPHGPNSYLILGATGVILLVAANDDKSKQAKSDEQTTNFQELALVAQESGTGAVLNK